MRNGEGQGGEEREGNGGQGYYTMSEKLEACSCEMNGLIALISMDHVVHKPFV